MDLPQINTSELDFLRNVVYWYERKYHVHILCGGMDIVKPQTNDTDEERMVGKEG